MPASRIRNFGQAAPGNYGVRNSEISMVTLPRNRGAAGTSGEGDGSLRISPLVPGMLYYRLRYLL